MVKRTAYKNPWCVGAKVLTGCKERGAWLDFDMERRHRHLKAIEENDRNATMKIRFRPSDFEPHSVIGGGTRSLLPAVADTVALVVVHQHTVLGLQQPPRNVTLTGRGAELNICHSTTDTGLRCGGVTLRALVWSTAEASGRRSRGGRRPIFPSALRTPWIRSAVPSICAATWGK